jgi:hypothetical protein
LYASSGSLNQQHTSVLRHHWKKMLVATISIVEKEGWGGERESNGKEVTQGEAIFLHWILCEIRVDNGRSDWTKWCKSRSSSTRETPIHSAITPASCKMQNVALSLSFALVVQMWARENTVAVSTFAFRVPPSF